MAGENSTRAILAAFFANLGIGIAKILGFFVTRSASLLAESVHSFADTANQLLLLLGGRLSRKAPTPTHPFGYGKERYFWSFIVSMVLFTLGGAFAIYEGINKIRHPEEFKSILWAVGILTLGIILETFSLATAIKESNKIRGDRTWTEFVKKSKSPELVVVLLEDLGALLGLFVALGAILLANFTGAYVWDGIGTLTIGVLLCLIAVVLSQEMRSMLLGESASPKNQKRIIEVFANAPGSPYLLELRTLHIGPDKLLVTSRVSFSDQMSSTEASEACNLITTQIQEALSGLVAAVDVYIHQE